MLRWMTAAQHEALIEEIAFDLYDVDDDRREKLGGRTYTFADLPAEAAFVSILDNERDNPMRRVAFRKDGDWRYRAPDPLPPRGVAVDTRWAKRDYRPSHPIAAINCQKLDFGRIFDGSQKLVF